MDKNSKLELENSREFHFVLLGYSKFKDIISKLAGLLPQYRIVSQGKISSREVVYDVEDNTLSNAGIVISIQEEKGKDVLKVRKLSRLVGNMKRPPKTYILGSVEEGEEPKDYSLQVSSAIESSFSTPFTVDLDDFVKKTIPKIEVDIEATKYNVICGTGYRANILCEKATYKDIKTGKKIVRNGVTLLLPREERPESEELLKIIDGKVCELALYNYSRFEIAQKLLYPKTEASEEDKLWEDEEEE